MEKRKIWFLGAQLRNLVNLFGLKGGGVLKSTQIKPRMTVIWGILVVPQVRQSRKQGSKCRNPEYFTPNPNREILKRNPQALAPLCPSWRREQDESDDDWSSEPWSCSRAGDINHQRAGGVRRRGILQSCSLITSVSATAILEARPDECREKAVKPVKWVQTRRNSEGWIRPGGSLRGERSGLGS